MNKIKGDAPSLTSQSGIAEPQAARAQFRVETIGDCTLYLGDCRDVLPSIASVDLVFTSPPYNMGSTPWKPLGHWKPGGKSGGRGKWKGGVNAGDGASYGVHDDAMPWPEYDAWQRATLSELWRITAPAGAIFYNHKPRVVGDRLWQPTELIPEGVLHRQSIVWARPGGMNFNATAFMPTHEMVLMLAHPAFRLRSRGASGLGDVWRLAPDVNEHPAPFPLALPYRAIEATAAEVVCDPFMGSGTTGVACAQLGRSFIGIELSPTFFDMACQRIAAAYREPTLFADAASPERDGSTLEPSTTGGAE